MDIDAGRHLTNTTTSISYVINNPLIDFIKQRDWQHCIVETIQDFLYVLALDGKILYASTSCVSITGYQSAQLAGHFIGEFIHPDDMDIFVKEMDDAIATRNPLRFFHRFRKADGAWVIFESHGHAHFSEEPSLSSILRGSIYDEGFFITSRPYPTKNAALMDSFLEHKIENERLMNRLRELREEEQEISGPQAWQEKTAEGDALVLGSNEVHALENPEKSSIPGSRSLEQVQNVKTTDTSRIGDVGIRFSLDPSGKKSSNRKKTKGPKVVRGYVCLSCGTIDSPEWRRGPNGSKTLCNACGLRWAKDRKKEQNEELGAFPTSATKP